MTTAIDLFGEPLIAKPVRKKHQKAKPLLREAGQLTVTSSEWYSPSWIVDPARDYLGGIDLDPASCALANTIVQATTFFGIEQNGLQQDWLGNWFGNPPSPPREWWNHAVRMHVEHRSVGVFLAYSIECLSQSQGDEWAAPMTNFSFCIPKRRIQFMTTVRAEMEKLVFATSKRPPPKEDVRKFWRLSEMDPGLLIKGDAPTHASALIAVGGDHDAFAKAFASVGEVVRGTGRKRV